jgi:hypothetical protein
MSDIHKKTPGTVHNFHMPRTAFNIQRGTVNFDGISIDGVLQLKASSLLNGKGILKSLTQNFHDFRDGLEEPD